MLVLALNVGTSSTRALCFDATGRAVPGAQGRVAYQPRTTPEGGVELEPDVLLEAVAGAVDACLAGAALLTLEALGVAAAPPLAPGTTLYPVPERHALYRNARER